MHAHLKLPTNLRNIKLMHIHGKAKSIVLIVLFINAGVVAFLLSKTQKVCEEVAFNCPAGVCPVAAETCKYVVHPALAGSFLALAFLLPFYFVLRSFDKG